MQKRRTQSSGPALKLTLSLRSGGSGDLARCGHDLFRRDRESHQLSDAERGGNRDVGGIPSARHDDPADPGTVVPRVKSVPAAVQVDFEPGAEIHRRRIAGDADIAEIAGAIPRRDIHAAAQRDREVGEVAADTDALLVPLKRGAVAARVVITE